MSYYELWSSMTDTCKVYALDGGGIKIVMERICQENGFHTFERIDEEELEYLLDELIRYKQQNIK